LPIKVFKVIPDVIPAILGAVKDSDGVPVVLTDIKDSPCDAVDIPSAGVLVERRNCVAACVCVPPSNRRNVGNIAVKVKLVNRRNPCPWDIKDNLEQVDVVVGISHVKSLPAVKDDVDDVCKVAGNKLNLGGSRHVNKFDADFVCYDISVLVNYGKGEGI